jgi:prophage regulatory protein
VTTGPFLDVMGAAEIGTLLGVSRQRVQQLVKTPGFPQPATVLGMGKLWRGEDVRAWAAQNRPTGAPRTPPRTHGGTAS